MNGAACIIMNCKTGEVLAMATHPSYDLNDPFTLYSETENERISSITDEEERKTAVSAAVKEQRKNKQ